MAGRHGEKIVAEYAQRYEYAPLAMATSPPFLDPQGADHEHRGVAMEVPLRM
jgi:hypothetical protein